MTFLPIVGRELRVASRRGATYWIRALAVLAALGGGIWVYALTYKDAPKETGKILFVALTVLANLYALLAGLRTTADCLSEEKREGTLGLLFLTDLKGYDIVLGKLAATSLSAFYALLAIFPVMGCSLMMGGVTAGEFGRVVLASLNNLLLGLAAGMFFSAVSRDDRKAFAGTFFLMMFVAALPVVGEICVEGADRRYLLPFFQLPSPSFTCFAAFEGTFRRGAPGVGFWISLGLVHGMSWVLLGLSCLVVPRTWQDRATARQSQGVFGRLRQWQYGSAEVRRQWRVRLLGMDPIVWLVSRERFKQHLVFVGLGALGGIWVWGYAELGRDWLEGVSIPWALAAHSVLKMWLCSESCRQFCEDRRSGAMELLLATPLRVPEILRGQRWALWRQFAWPTLVVLGADTLLMASVLDQMRGDEGIWIGVWLAGMGMLVWDLHALSWVGPWMGLNSRSPTRACTAALARICVLPWLLYGAGLAVLAVLEITSHLNMSGRWLGATLIVAWFILGGVINLLFTSWAAHRLKTEFRQVAMRRFEVSRYAEWARALGELLRGTR